MRSNPDTGVLGLVFDFGLKHIGLAVAQRPAGVARALTTIGAKDGEPLWTALDPIVAEWRPTILVVGLPLNMDGTPSAMAERARVFGEQLAARYSLPNDYVDERLSTFEAESRIGERSADGRKRTSTVGKSTRRNSENTRLHALAAEVIAETWLRR